MYDSLNDLLKKKAGALSSPGKSPRVYKVSVGDTTKYVLAASPGAAASQLCDVELVPRGDLTQSLLEVVSGVSYRPLPYPNEKPVSSDDTSAVCV